MNRPEAGSVLVCVALVHARPAGAVADAPVPGRVAGLDGIRGLAALWVVLDARAGAGRLAPRLGRDVRAPPGLADPAAWPPGRLAASAPVVALIAVEGSTRTDENLFWVDLAWGPALGCFLAAVATSRPRPVARILETRPLRGLGSFSYSLYLTHAPIVIAVSYGLVLGRIPSGTLTFLVLTAILVPLTVAFARLFAAVFELPFQRHR